MIFCIRCNKECSKYHAFIYNTATCLACYETAITKNYMENK